MLTPRTIAACSLLCVSLLAGCRQECVNEAPVIRLELSLAPGVDGSKLVRLTVDLTAGGKQQRKVVQLNGSLADGETSLELVLGAFAAGGFDATVQVRAHDGAGKVAASAQGAVSGGADACVVLELALGVGDRGDAGPPPPDGPVMDGPPQDRGKVKDGPIPDRPKKKKDGKVPDKSPPKPDKKLPKPDKKLPKPDKSQPKPDLPVGPCGGKPNGTACPNGKCLGGKCCKGCVSGSVCSSGTSNSKCGSGGAACSPCKTSNPCKSATCSSAGQCKVSTRANGSTCTGGRCAKGACCSGCVDSSWTCQTGTGASACGKGGVSCHACTSSVQCVTPYCKSTGTCGVKAAANGTACTGGKCYLGGCCKGCVGASKCQVGTSKSYCGTSGATCKTCSTSNPCKTATCKPPCSYGYEKDGTACPYGVCSKGVCICTTSSHCKSHPYGKACLPNKNCGCYSTQDCPTGKKCVSYKCK